MIGKPGSRSVVSCSAMTNPAIVSKEGKIKLVPHCITCAERASSQCQTFRLSRAAVVSFSSPLVRNTWWEFHSNMAESPPVSSPSLIHEIRTVNVKTFEIQKTSVCTTAWKEALYDTYRFPKPAVRIVLRVNWRQEWTCLKKESEKSQQFEHPSVPTDAKPTKMASADESAPCQTLAAHYPRQTEK